MLEWDFVHFNHFMPVSYTLTKKILILTDPVDTILFFSLSCIFLPTTLWTLGTMLNKSNSTISLFIEDQGGASSPSLLFTQNIHNSVVVPNV